jgi:hypothetical protein
MELIVYQRGLPGEILGIAVVAWWIESWMICFFSHRHLK